MVRISVIFVSEGISDKYDPVVDDLFKQVVIEILYITTALLRLVT